MVGRVLVVMGVAGSGKSTVAAAVARHWPGVFVDADDHHSASNVAKMACGTALTDKDRWPWLDMLGAFVAAAASTSNVVLACSSLKQSHRQAILVHIPDAWFVHLDVSEAQILGRIAARSGHFMMPCMVPSQFATLEPPGPDEKNVLVVDANAPLNAVVRCVLALI